MTIALLIAWWLSGCLSFTYWWRRDRDFTAAELPITLILGVFGPFVFLFGWVCHYEDGNRY